MVIHVPARGFEPEPGHGDLIPVLAVGSLISGPLHLGTAVGIHAGHHTPDGIDELLEVGHGVGVEKLVRCQGPS